MLKQKAEKNLDGTLGLISHFLIPWVFTDGLIN